MPAQAGIHVPGVWTPAFAGVTFRAAGDEPPPYIIPPPGPRILIPNP
jgi:hypothetical protein